jgi:hypothetical protein
VKFDTIHARYAAFLSGEPQQNPVRPHDSIFPDPTNASSSGLPLLFPLCMALRKIFIGKFSKSVFKK